MTPCAHDFDCGDDFYANFYENYGEIICLRCHADITAEYLEWLKTKKGTEMQRESRYLMAKLKDITKYLSDDDASNLIGLVKKVDQGREHDGKRPLQCVCVEDDWPEYEEVWAMIAARVDDVPLYKARMGAATGSSLDGGLTDE